MKYVAADGTRIGFARAIAGTSGGIAGAVILVLACQAWQRKMLVPKSRRRPYGPNLIFRALLIRKRPYGTTRYAYMVSF